MTVFFALAVFAAGCVYHYFYALERSRTREAVRGFYLKYFDREPDAQGHAHWTRWAQDRWGLEKVERLGFAEAKRKSEAKRDAVR